MMKPRLPVMSPDARTVLPGREVTYRGAPTVSADTRAVGSPRHDMRMLVLNVLVGARARWDQLSVADKQKVVRHLRSIANLIEKAVGGDAP
jgi:hypothetical protein